MENINNAGWEAEDKILVEFLNFNYKSYIIRGKKNKVSKKLKTCMKIIQKDCDLKAYRPINEDTKIWNELSFKYLIDIMAQSKSYKITDEESTYLLGFFFDYSSKEILSSLLISSKSDLDVKFIIENIFKEKKVNKLFRKLPNRLISGEFFEYFGDIIKSKGIEENPEKLKIYQKMKKNEFKKKLTSIIKIIRKAKYIKQKKRFKLVTKTFLNPKASTRRQKKLCCKFLEIFSPKDIINLLLISVKSKDEFEFYKTTFFTKENIKNFINYLTSK